MFEEYIDEQKIICETLKNTLISGGLSHAYLFDISNYPKSYNLIMEFVKCIICKKRVEEGNSHKNCDICLAIDEGNYPDIEIIKPDGLWIKKEQMDLLQTKFSTKSILDNYKIYIIDGAESLNASSANSILKFLEEPEEKIIAILLTKNINNVLNTIKSRCINFTFKTIEDKSDEQDKLLNYLFPNINDKEDFINQYNIDEMIKTCFNFVKSLEKDRKNTLIHIYNLWFSIFSDKQKNIIGYELLLLIYKDIINIKINKKPEFFIKYMDELSIISCSSTIDKLYKQINIIIDHKERNKINININSNMDNMILEMEEAI